MKRTLKKTLVLVLSMTFALSAFSGCKKEKEDENKGIDLSEFTIVCADNAAENVVDAIIEMKDSIKKIFGAELSVSNDTDSEPSGKEILIGDTNREATDTALAKLSYMTNEEGYIIDISENSIVLVGSSSLATKRAIKIFISDYIKRSAGSSELNVDAGLTKGGTYDVENIIYLENGVEVEIEHKMTIMEVPKDGYSNILGYPAEFKSMHYPSIITLQHQPNEEDNGKLIAHYALSMEEMYDRKNTSAMFVESDDEGNTWSVLGRPEPQDVEHGGYTPGGMSHLYELPAAVGNFPKGTLVYSSNSTGHNKTQVWIWYSTDLGKTWTQTALLADEGGELSGVWEPFTYYNKNDGYLYCFYSDESDPDHAQKLVYQRSKDGVNWSERVDVIALKDKTARPGMFVMTEMGNGEYFMTYEYVGRGAELYCKTTKDISDWGDPTETGALIKAGNYVIGSAPGTIWLPTGGDCGMLIVHGRKECANGDGTHRFMVSFDYGKTWTTMENPLPHNVNNDFLGTERIGYSPSFAVSADGKTVYYMIGTDVPETGRHRMQFCRFTVY